MINVSQYRQKGFTGLKNLGNTCFLNSCLQILKHTYELGIVLKMNKKNDVVDSVILTEWIELEKDLWKNNTIVSPNRFVSKVQSVAREKNIELFTGWAQNDMSEFLLLMIECIHNSISRPVRITIRGVNKNDMDKNAILCYKMLQKQYEKEYSEIMDIFYAIYVSEIISLNSSKVLSSKPESFFILDLPIPTIPNNERPVNLSDCFNELTKSELLEGDNAWYNESSKKYQSVHKRMSFWSLPKVLVVTFKRFSPCGTQKIEEHIDFPLNNLILSKYVCGYNPEKYVYDLFGVCNHYGGIEGGHYTSFVLNADGIWTHYNDSQYTIIQKENVVSKSAYCLFYRLNSNLIR